MLRNQSAEYTVIRRNSVAACRDRSVGWQSLQTAAIDKALPWAVAASFLLVVCDHHTLAGTVCN